MSTSSSNQTPNHLITTAILGEFESISQKFSAFQNANSLSCPPGCGKCCFKADIYCAPIELLPLAMELLERGEAEAYLEKCQDIKEDRCLFLSVQDEKTGKGVCTEYKYRPLVCRTFGVAPRHDKNGLVNFSVCTTLKETNPESFAKLQKRDFTDVEIPFIDQSKNKLACLDPRLAEEEFPINESLAMILEKVLFYESFNASPRN